MTMSVSIIPLPIGDAAPDFSLADQHNVLFSLSTHRGKWVVIYFYPTASTPGCTAQACQIQAQQSAWRRLNTLVVGISPDPVKALARFKDEQQLTFPLLADTDHQVADLYGAWQEKSMYGRTYWGNARMTYIIDPQGQVAYVQPAVKPATHAAEILGWLEQHAA